MLYRLFATRKVIQEASVDIEASDQEEAEEKFCTSACNWKTPEDEEFDVEINDITEVKDYRIPYGAIIQQDALYYDLLESTKFKPCPFCESDDIKTSIHLKGIEVGNYHHLYSIFCCTCGVNNSLSNPEMLFNWWNRIADS